MKRIAILIAVLFIAGCAGGDEDVPFAMTPNDAAESTEVAQEAAAPMCVDEPDCAGGSAGGPFFESPTCPGRICAKQCDAFHCKLHNIDPLTGERWDDGRPGLVDTVYCPALHDNDCNEAPIGRPCNGVWHNNVCVEADSGV